MVDLTCPAPVRSNHLILRSPTRRVTSKGPCHLASNLELEVGSNAITLSPGAKLRCPGPVTNSSWRAAPRCEVLFSGFVPLAWGLTPADSGAGPPLHRGCALGRMLE